MIGTGVEWEAVGVVIGFLAILVCVVGGVILTVSRIATVETEARQILSRIDTNGGGIPTTCKLCEQRLERVEGDIGDCKQQFTIVQEKLDHIGLIINTRKEA